MLSCCHIANGSYSDPYRIWTIQSASQRWSKLQRGKSKKQMKAGLEQDLGNFGQSIRDVKTASWLCCCDCFFFLERYRYYVQHLGLWGRCSLKPTSSNIISGLRASCPIQERQLDSGDCISDASDLSQSDRSEEEVGSRVSTKAGTLWYWASQLQRAGMGGARDWEADNGLGNQRWLEQRMGQATNWKLPVVETWLVFSCFSRSCSVVVETLAGKKGLDEGE